MKTQTISGKQFWRIIRAESFDIVQNTVDDILLSNSRKIPIISLYGRDNVSLILSAMRLPVETRRKNGGFI